ncbi:diguanylate cyclase [Chitinibacter bivalviorum]|uniref:Diguanylate cyclase n=1 Tax=Chitinibacter bivalviorum TaxID=2739434 RepID=A0A7H9BK85_9NEIS|nr:diguanylate cyclase [Chitinibacter bivalviorum]QLG88736.1 diguanylate cyclase [Chitinibacter bivalviorum]
MDQQQWLSSGQQFERQGQYSAAMKAWLAGLESAQDLSDEVLYWAKIGELLRKANQAERALAVHQHAYMVTQLGDYQHSLLQLQIGLDLLALEQAEMAKQALQRALQFPNVRLCPVLQELISQLQSELGELALAQQALILAIKLYQNDAMAIAHCSLALLKLFAKSPEIGGEQLSWAIDIANQHLPLLIAEARQMAIELGRACQTLGRDQEAAVYFRQALALPAVSAALPSKPRRLAMIEYKLQQITSEIEIELLREKNEVQHQQVQQLEAVGFRDDITGLYHSRYLTMRWEGLLEQAAAGVSLALLSIGIDFYASISEVLGKESAMLIYVQIAQVLQSEAPSDAVLVTSSSGAFELVTLGKHPSQLDEMIAKVQRKISQLEQVYLPEPLSISVGGAMYQAGEARDVFQLRANLALFLAQRKESNHICWDGTL